MLVVRLLAKESPVSREIRRVPVDWQHPMQPRTRPLWGREKPSRLCPTGYEYAHIERRSYGDVLSEWERKKAAWEAGEGPSQFDMTSLDTYWGEEPEEDRYMPDFPEDAVLGYCLYQTVSEGTPVTPVFATEDELIEHLVMYGEDYDQVPMRRRSAEIVVRGGWAPSGAVINGTFLKGASDMDRMEDLLER